MAAQVAEDFKMLTHCCRCKIFVKVDFNNFLGKAKTCLFFFKNKDCFNINYLYKVYPKVD